MSWGDHEHEEINRKFGITQRLEAEKKEKDAKKHKSKAENSHISGVSKSYSGEDKLPHELAFEMENRYLNAPIIKITNHDTGNINHVNLYDLIDGMSNPIDNGIQWAELWFSFKGKKLEFEVIDNKKAS